MTSTSRWLLLAASQPGPAAGSARVRLWRALKDLGAASLRDGVTLFPASEKHRADLENIVAHVEAHGGSAWLLEFASQPPAVEQKLHELFDRRERYDGLSPVIAEFRAEMTGLDEAAARRRLRQIERDFQAIAEIDFFPGDSQLRVREALDELAALVNQWFSPDEPTAARGEIERRDRMHFQDRRWATRAGLWVDRAASAWLIKRFVDPRAHFVWLTRPEDCPADAVGFDFDGATFSHVGEHVTFEVLLASFSLDGDQALLRLGQLVRYLDVGGVAVAEAAGFEAVLAGLRETSADDDRLLEAVSPVLDALYRRFSVVGPDCATSARGGSS